jgi:sulfopropanediol 3-dehydrogenase
MHMGGAHEIYVWAACRPSGAMAIGTETIKPRSTCWSARATPLSPKPSASFTGASASTCSPARPRRWSSPTTPWMPNLCATDLLGQAEHGYNSPAVLVTNSRKLAEGTLAEVDRLLTILPTVDTAGQSWRDYGEVILCDSYDEMLAVANDIASNMCR